MRSRERIGSIASNSRSRSCVVATGSGEAVCCWPARGGSRREESGARGRIQLARGVGARGVAFQRGAGQSAAHLRVRLNHGASDITQSLRPSSAGPLVRPSPLSYPLSPLSLSRPTKRPSPSLPLRHTLSSSLFISLSAPEYFIFVALVIIVHSLSLSLRLSLVDSSRAQRDRERDSFSLLLRVDFPTISRLRSTPSRGRAL